MSDSDIVSIHGREEPRDHNDYTGRTIEGYVVGEKLGEGEEYYEEDDNIMKE